MGTYAGGIDNGLQPWSYIKKVHCFRCPAGENYYFLHNIIVYYIFM